jgi:uncharacterized protein YcfJ
MKKAKTLISIFGVLALTSTLTGCGGGGDDPGKEASAEEEAPTFATITSVEPINETTETPREVCEDVTITEQAPVKDEKQIGGSVAGAVVGGVIGNQVGDGRGKKLATVAGAAAGGYAGNKVQENMQQGKTQTRTEQQCETVVDKNTTVVGYTVKYDLGGKPGSVRMDQPPEGTTLPVVNGQLVLQSAAPSQ